MVFVLAFVALACTMWATEIARVNGVLPSEYLVAFRNSLPENTWAMPSDRKPDQDFVVSSSPALEMNSWDSVLSTTKEHLTSLFQQISNSVKTSVLSSANTNSEIPPTRKTRRTVRGAMGLLSLHARDLLPGEEEFTQRVIRTIEFHLNDQNNPSRVLHFLGGPFSGKHRLAKTLGQAMFRTDANKDVWPEQVFQATFTSEPAVEDTLELARKFLANHAETGALLVLDGFAQSASKPTWDKLKRFLGEEPWKAATSSLLVFVDSVTGNSPLATMRFGSSMDLDDARDLARETLFEWLGESGEVDASIVPFLAKSVRSIELKLARACSLLLSELYSMRNDHVLVCDTKTLAQAAIKVEPCVEKLGMFKTAELFQHAMREALFSTKDALQKSSMVLTVDATEKGACDAGGMRSWIGFTPLSSF